jgi:uncharacterized protein
VNLETPFADHPALVELIRSRYRLRWNGIHGYPHWVRVRENGFRLAERTGARADIVELFALFHDACRLNDDHDPQHGWRGAELARSLCPTGFQLDDQGLELLADACARHTDGHLEGDITVQTCWDADRLDLARVGKTPRSEKLCTEAARDPQTLQWAIARSLLGD